MTKLEEKLIELGYNLEKVEYMEGKPLCAIYEKHFDFCYIECWQSLVNSYFTLRIVYTSDGFRIKEVLKDLRQAFNVMQKDLEILKECEE